MDQGTIARYKPNMKAKFFTRPWCPLFGGKISLIKAKGVDSVAQKMRDLHRRVRLVFDYLRMSNNSLATAAK
jgi:hypothetical protein